MLLTGARSCAGTSKVQPVPFFSIFNYLSSMAIQDLQEITRRLISELELLAEKNRQTPGNAETIAIRDTIKKRIQDLKDKLEDAQRQLDDDSTQ